MIMQKERANLFNHSKMQVLWRKYTRNSKRMSENDMLKLVGLTTTTKYILLFFFFVVAWVPLKIFILSLFILSVSLARSMCHKLRQNMCAVSCAFSVWFSTRKLEFTLSLKTLTEKNGILFEAIVFTCTRYNFKSWCLF